MVVAMEMEPKQYYASLPQKYISAGALILNKKKQILLVKPNYKPRWLLPGGAADAQESIKDTCRREVKEEICLDIGIGRLLLVVYKTKYISALKKHNEYISFIFYGGILTEKQVRAIKLCEKELTAYRFADPAAAARMMAMDKQRALPFLLKALKNNACYYLEIP